MLKTCPTCGKLHKIDEVCPVRQQRRAEYLKRVNQKRKSERNSEKAERNSEKAERNSEADRFRNTKKWQRKRKQILSRDLCMCRVCFLLENKITTGSLNVHHIEPLSNNFDKRLDDKNLITLCRFHHEKAESGEISADTLRGLIKMKLKIT